MAWLTSLLKRPKATDDESAAKNGSQPPQVAGGPPLAILAPDIGGISSFKLRFFPDAATAAAEIEQLSPEMRRGTHAFWALHDEPVLPADGHREALVLIRANLTSDVVYAVSFVDMGSAWSFARFEAKRGLDVSHLIILWAAFATVREELDGVTVLPAAPPATNAQHAGTLASQSTIELEATETVREYERREEPISNAAAAPEAPEETKLAEAETERRDEAARRAEANEAARVARQAEEELQAARAAADAARAQAEAEATRRQETERLMEEQRQAEARARAEAEAEAERRAEATRSADAEKAARIARQAEEELRAAREAADAARAQAEAEATRHQETERLMQEQRQAEAQARAEAEARAKAEAKARAKAEARAEAEAKARAKAEARAEAKAEAKARAKAEAKADEERRADAARRAEAEEAARIARQPEEELRAARAAADAVRVLAKAEVTRRQEAERLMEEQRQANEAAARSGALAAMASGIESALTPPAATPEEPIVLDATSVALEGLAEAHPQPLLEDPSPTIKAPAESRSFAGDEETLTDDALDDGDEPAARGTVFAHAPATETEEDTETIDIPEHLRRADDSRDPADDLPKNPKLDEFDIAYEVARLLENRRWDKREEPFQGFDSPPGKF